MSEVEPCLDPPDASPEAVIGLLGRAGPVAAAHESGAGGYEERPQQLEMAGHVARTLAAGGAALLEAGTGVGKSFAYLVPALAWAARTGRRVAIATSTIALQEQLVRRDLPLLTSALPFDVDYALVKGRGNYLCLRRMYRAIGGQGVMFEDEERAQLEAIRTWAHDTKEGSRQDLPFQPSGAVWEQVNAEQGNCLGRQCAHYQACHYQRSRQRAHDARVLILNHHLLMADLAMRRTGAGFLPTLDAIIVDEAHDLEDTAAEHLGVRVSARGVMQQLGRLWSERRGKGLLAGRGSDSLRAAVQSVRAQAHTFFEQTRGVLGGFAGSDARAASIPHGTHLADEFSPRLATLASRLLAEVHEGGERESALEIGARARGLRALADGLGALTRNELPGHVRWGELSSHGSLALYSAPVDVGAALQEVLFDAHHAVVLTSATLATGRPPSFAFVRQRLGVVGGTEAAIGSPFDFTRQARLVLRHDLPDPAREPSAFEAELPEAVAEAVHRTRGGAFVLFTSLQSMRRCADTLRANFEDEGWRVLVQGEALERPALLDAFREGDAVLFGVASFWQGVDVPGDALRHVIITRLPFEVPTHPLQVARREVLEARGGQSFRDLSLPMTALRLKQGFGRLIRRATDRGVVTILDPRIVTKNYGRWLVDSLPDCPRELVPDVQEP
ncbi:MAG: ATP-dependent DNA helicase [Planctomycetota bacterium]|nr:ATP-dependent DNA helicase [Planctomycetota bacterium]